MDDLRNLSIIIDNVTKAYPLKKGIFDLSVTLDAGQLHLFVGENGSGKSTLLRCIMGLVHYQGKILKRKYRIGYAPEEYILPPQMNVIDFLTSIGRIKQSDRQELDLQLDHYLRFFGLDGVTNKPLAKLSHGMRQKVNLIQAFIHDPKILILDEPLTALDKETIQKVVRLIREKSRHALVVVSTHQPQAFKSRNRRTYRLHQGQLVVPANYPTQS